MESLNKCVMYTQQRVIVEAQCCIETRPYHYIVVLMKVSIKAFNFFILFLCSIYYEKKGRLT